MLTILNSISSLNAENALSSTQANLQKTLTQLSTGLRINSGADDAAGLSIANGLSANIAALTQSSSNASDGIGALQTADGAMSQVTTLLNRAVTLATEASNGGLSSSQSTALDTEYQSILTEIGNISTIDQLQRNGRLRLDAIRVRNRRHFHRQHYPCRRPLSPLWMHNARFDRQSDLAVRAQISELTEHHRRDRNGRRRPRLSRRGSEPVDRQPERRKHRSHQPDQRPERHPECGHRQDGRKHDPVQRSAADRHGGLVAVQPGAAVRPEAAPVISLANTLQRGGAKPGAATFFPQRLNFPVQGADSVLRLETWMQARRLTANRVKRSRHCYELCLGTQFAIRFDVVYLIDRPEFHSRGGSGSLFPGNRRDSGRQFRGYRRTGTGDRHGRTRKLSCRVRQALWIQLQTDASNLDNDMQSLNSLVGPLSARTVTSSNSSIVSAAAASGTKPGNHVRSRQKPGYDGLLDIGNVCQALRLHCPPAALPSQLGPVPRRPFSRMEPRPWPMS